MAKKKKKASTTGFSSVAVKRPVKNKFHIAVAATMFTFH